jgi:hypothetical protein
MDGGAASLMLLLRRLFQMFLNFAVVNCPTELLKNKIFVACFPKVVQFCRNEQPN